MPQPTPETISALAISDQIIKFATENKTGLPADVVTKITAALNAHASNTWTDQISTDFWTAYDQLCSHLKPVTVDTFKAAQPKPFRPLGAWGPVFQVSTPRRWAYGFSGILLALLAATALSLFMASAGDTLLSEIEKLKTQGDATVQEIRHRLVEMPCMPAVPQSDARLKQAATTKLEASAREELRENAICLSPELRLNDTSLPRPVKEWAHHLNANLLTLFATSDHLYEKANATVFRLLLIEKFEPCPAAGDCYHKGRLNDIGTIKDLNDNIDSFFDYYETRRAVEERQEQASTRLKMLTICVLPALLGMLGACTYVVRNISDEVRDSTFTSTSALRYFLRVVLGSIVGIIVTVLWTKGTTENITATGLSATGLSFVAGYAIEPLFATLDFLFEKFRK